LIHGLTYSSIIHQDAEKDRQRRSQSPVSLQRTPRYASVAELPAALLNGLFEHLAEANLEPVPVTFIVER